MARGLRENFGRVRSGGRNIQIAVSRLSGPYSHEQDPSVPLGHRDGPLPHHGLFIRRNNAFGTRSTLGITDQIEQGVLIEQRQIRFDDFVATNVDQIPYPPAGAGIVISHGATPVAAAWKARPATTHFLEIALRAAPSAVSAGPDVATLRANFIFVVDTSGSMSGEKLDMVKSAVGELHARLRDTDILGIVTFDTQVHTLLKATPRRQLSVEDLTQLVGGLRAGGGTDLNMGLLYGIDELTRHSDERPDVVNCLYLFSDGEPTSGETDWIKIRTNIAARIRGEMTLSCFGFGSDARMRELDALAGLTGGHSTFVVRPEDVRINLLEDLARRERLAAINIQLQIEIDPSIAIWHLYGHDMITDPVSRAAVEESAGVARRRALTEYGVESLPDLITESAGIRIFAPDLAFGETYWVVLELEVAAGADPVDFGRARVQYVDTVSRESVRREVVLSPSGVIPADTVLVHAIGLWTSEVTFYALDDLYQNDRETAKTRLSNHVQVLKAAHAAVPATQFRDDQVTLMKLISLTGNLGNRLSWSDQPGLGGYTLVSLNTFGQVRSGFVTTRSGTF